MIASTPWPGLIGSSVLLACVVFAVISKARPPRRVGVAVLVGTFVVGLVPIGSLSLAASVRALTGELSVTSLVLLIGWAGGRVLEREMFSQAGLNRLMALVAVAALTLYPATLGLTTFDPYALGYRSWVFLGAVLMVGLTAWIFDCRVVAVCTAGAMTARAIGFFESANLWDYLIDPLVAITACAWTLHRVVLSRSQQRRNFG